MDELLIIKDLTTEIPSAYGTITPVDHVSFIVKAGEAFGLVGESGSGKSMTCRSILRILQPPAHITGGQVIFNGKVITTFSEKEFTTIRGKGISMVFQDPMTSLNPVITAGDQIYEVFDSSFNSAQRREFAIQLLKQVGISSPEERLKEYPHQFSGGMRQRVMIAITLARNPQLLLADEPTTALDVTIQDQILELLSNLQQDRNMSLILVSHDLGVVARVCERMAVMYAGQIVEMAPTKEIFEHPYHPYTIGLMNSMPRLEKVSDWLKPISGMPPDLYNLPAGCRFEPRCPWASPECREQAVEMQDINPAHLSRCIKATQLGQGKGYTEKERQA